MFDSFFLISLLFLWGIIHSLLASLTFKKFIKNRIGDLPFNYYRLLYNAFALVSFLPVIGWMLIIPDKPLYAIPKPWAIIPLIIQFSSLVILAIGLKQTGALEFLGLRVFMGKTDIFPQSLNKNGLYQYVRHPLYSAGLVFMWSLPIMTVNFLIVIICLSIYIIIGAIFEERKLESEYGDVYRDYREKVPMLIPRPIGTKKNL